MLKQGTMRQALFISIIFLAGIACSTTRNTPRIHTKEEADVKNDSIEYSLETFDAKFETWYQIQNQPSKYRSQPYYENWNHQYVNAWNYKSTQSGNRFFEPIIGYEPTTDYGFELNHKLFYYFQYVERVLNIPILPGGPRSIVF